MAYCSAGDLSQYIRKRGQVEALHASTSSAASIAYTAPIVPIKELYPHPKEGGLNEVVVRSFLGQLCQYIINRFYFFSNYSISGRSQVFAVSEHHPSRYQAAEPASRTAAVRSLAVSASTRHPDPANSRLWLCSLPSTSFHGRDALWLAALYGAGDTALREVRRQSGSVERWRCSIRNGGRQTAVSSAEPR